LHDLGFVEDVEAEDSVTVVKRRPEDLAAGDVLERRRDAADGEDLVELDRHGVGQSRLGRAIGSQEQHRFVEIAASLGDRERGELRGVERALAHHPVDKIGQCRLDRAHCRTVEATIERSVERLRALDRLLAAAGGDVGHGRTSTSVVRGIPTTRLSGTRNMSHPSG
jgi:hypothetical protein